MDAELCVLELCQPELSLDAKSLNARLSRLEEQFKTGNFTVVQAENPLISPTAEQKTPEIPPEEKPLPEPVSDELPMGFWAELVAGVRQEIKPPVSGFFVSTENAPIHGVMVKGVLELRCKNTFTAEMVGKTETLQVVSRKASAMLGRPVKVVTVDLSMKPSGNARMENLLRFGRDHSDIINMKE